MTKRSQRQFNTLRLHGEGASLLEQSLHVFEATVRDSCNVHDHEYMEIVLVTGGRGTHVSQAGVHSLSSGDVIVLRPGAWHSYKGCDNLIVFNCCVSMQLFVRGLAVVMEHPAMNRLFWSGPLSAENRGSFMLKLNESDRIACRKQL